MSIKFRNLNNKAKYLKQFKDTKYSLETIRLNRELVYSQKYKWDYKRDQEAIKNIIGNLENNQNITCEHTKVYLVGSNNGILLDYFNVSTYFTKLAYRRNPVEYKQFCFTDDSAEQRLRVIEAKNDNEFAYSKHIMSQNLQEVNVSFKDSAITEHQPDESTFKKNVLKSLEKMKICKLIEPMQTVMAQPDVGTVLNIFSMNFDTVFGNEFTCFSKNSLCVFTYNLEDLFKDFFLKLKDYLLT